MSFRGLLAHRATITRMDETVVDGNEVFVPRPISTNVPCRIDLSFIRSGKDPQWSPEAGRQADRTGVLFLPPGFDIRNGDRIQLTSGPIQGVFLVDGSVEQIIGRRNRVHHLEVGVKEVPGPLARAVV